MKARFLYVNLASVNVLSMSVKSGVDGDGLKMNMDMKRKMFLGLAIVVACLSCLNVFAQKKEVTGIIVDQEGKPVKGARIGIVNTTFMEKTNKKGEFRLKDVLPTDSVVIFLKGNRGAKFLLGDATQLQLKVKSDALLIDNGKSVTSTVSVETLMLKRYGSGSVVTAQMIERNGYLTIKEAIKSCISGVSFDYSEDGEKVIIRGSKSLNLSTDPLVLLDGVETTFAAADQGCHVNDVEIIEVIKDGLGYGAKGANGVIVIKTKK